MLHKIPAPCFSASPSWRLRRQFRCVVFLPYSLPIFCMLAVPFPSGHLLSSHSRVIADGRFQAFRFSPGLCLPGARRVRMWHPQPNSSSLDAQHPLVSIICSQSTCSAIHWCASRSFYGSVRVVSAPSGFLGIDAVSLGTCNACLSMHVPVFGGLRGVDPDAGNSSIAAIVGICFVFNGPLHPP